MEKIITFDTIRQFAYVNDNICKKPICGIVVAFFGLSATVMYHEDFPDAEFFAERGILHVVPYNNPWSWMNRQAVDYTDEILDVLIEHYALDKNLPVVSSGASMGGQSALVYTAYSAHKPIACVANCPVCDVVYHFTERFDLPRTLYSALYREPGTLEDALKSISPLHLASKMPPVEYHIFHCNQDKSVNIDAHSEKFVAEMRRLNHHITYDIVDGRGHGDLTPEMREKYMNYTVEHILH